MKQRGNLSIRQKLAPIVLITCGVSILPACALFGFYDLMTVRGSVASELGPL